MKRFSTRRPYVTLVALVCGALVTTSTSATANTSDSVTTKEVAAAINAVERTNGKLVAEPVTSTSDSDSAAVTTQNGVTVDVPRDATDGITFSRGKTMVTIGLPNAGTAGTAQRLADGTITYPSKNGASADAVLPLTNGAQALNVIRNKDAAENFGYALRKAPKGSRFTIAHDGSALLVDAKGKFLNIGAPTPWAQDAKGKLVKTSYRTDAKGQILTQHVAHKAGGVTYPVVADPRFDYYWWGWTMRLSRTDTQALAVGAIGLIGIAHPVAGLILTIGGMYFAQTAVAQRTCVGYAYPWGSARGWLYFTSCYA